MVLPLLVFTGVAVVRIDCICQREQMLANIPRPFRNDLSQLSDIAGKKRSCCFLKTGVVSSHGMHKPIGGFLRLAFLVSGFTAAQCVLNQFA